MKAGFGRADVTPRPGAELAGFGPYIHRYALDVRDRLYARAVAVSDGEHKWVLVSADLIGLDSGVVREARRIVNDETGLAPERAMLHATHTHSGPATVRSFIGWGEPDPPYMERLPALLARAAREAVENLQEAELSYAEVPAEGIGYNRELEHRPAYEDALDDRWRPGRPELTDTTAHVISVRAGERLLGFLSSFSCHPVVCCEQTHSIHGDYCGVATNLVEREHPGATGMFLQGAHGDINTCVCHMPQEESMRALDVIAARYARSIRRGMEEARPLGGTPVSAALERATFRRQALTREELEADLEEELRLIHEDPGGDASRECRMAAVRAQALRKLIGRLKRGEGLERPADVQVLRAGDLTIFGTPFELFRGIKERVVNEAGNRPTLVLSTTNDYLGYAPTRETFSQKDDGRGHYACDVVPVILGAAPFAANLEDEIVNACLRVLEESKGS